MQISRIANTNFGRTLATGMTEEKPNIFYNLDYHNKLNVLYDMFQKAGKERKIIAQNQAKMFEKMKDGFRILATHGDNCYTCSSIMGSSFDDAKLKNL